MNRIDLKDKKIIVMGYALTGRGVARFLLDQGARVIINDQSDLLADPTIEEFVKDGAQIIGNGHPIEMLDDSIDFIVKNPGIPYQVPFLMEAMNRNIPVYTDVELFSWFNPGKLVGITGSNGKTTTTSLVYQIIKNSNLVGHLAGNIGIPTLSVLPNVKKNDVVIMELSSFQLAGTDRFSPFISVITNLFEAHLDYHETKQAYIEAKTKILANQNENDYFVFNADDLNLLSIANEAKMTLIPFARKNVNTNVKNNGVYYENGALFFKDELIINQKDILIPGEHNIENILAAIAVAKLLNIDNQTIQKTISQYQGVPYRIQPLGKKRGVSYFNDSKATNPQATITALNSFNQPIVYIGGGLDRGIDFSELIPHLTKVTKAYLYGESRELMRLAFKKAGVPEIEVVETLSEATQLAIQHAINTEIVLFSPSCASWDQFKNFELRGELFTKLINAID